MAFQGPGEQGDLGQWTSENPAPGLDGMGWEAAAWLLRAKCRMTRHSMGFDSSCLIANYLSDSLMP